MKSRTLTCVLAAAAGAALVVVLVVVLVAAQAVAPLSGPARAAGVRAPVVVELFTSQGCNSCPPADAFLGKLATRPGVIALSYHVDYWNYLGWRDPFSSKAATKRQKAYRWAMHTSMIYTPQMIVDGRYQGVGSHVATIDRLVAKAAATAGQVNVVLTRAGDDMVKATLGSVPGVAEADIRLVFYDKARVTRIGSGENGGRTITYHHVVRDFRVIGMYDGKATTLTLPAKDSSGVKRWGVALLIQKPNSGPIIGAATVTGD